MNKLFYCTVFTSIVFFLGCSPSNPTNPNNSPYTLDPNVFFTVNFNGNTLTTNDIIGDSGFSGATMRTQNVNGAVRSTLTFYAYGSYVNNLLSAFSTNYQIQKCDGGISCEKLGNAGGTYYANPVGGASITDILAGNKVYDIDRASAVINVSSFQIGNYVTGTFTCDLIDGSTRIPATGSFRLRLN